MLRLQFHFSLYLITLTYIVIWHTKKSCLFLHFYLFIFCVCVCRLSVYPFLFHFCWSQCIIISDFLLLWMSKNFLVTLKAKTEYISFSSLISLHSIYFISSFFLFPEMILCFCGELWGM